MARKVVSRATYWRRRVVVLMAGMAVLGLPIWAVNEALGGSQPPGHGSQRSLSGDVAAARPQAGHGRWQGSARQIADLGSGPRAPAGSRGASTPRSPRTGRQTCARGAVLLTIRSARHRYRPGVPVTFIVGAATTRRRPCRVDLGPRFTSVVVASGDTPLWDSSSCPRGTVSRVVTLRRGAPAAVRVTWDRRTSLSGCPGQGTAAAAGTYTAAAFNGRVRSRPTTFALTGRRAAAP